MQVTQFALAAALATVLCGAVACNFSSQQLDTQALDSVATTKLANANADVRAP